MYSVGEYNGTVDISVPLYNLTYKDIDLPLAIHYNTQGVKVSSEASWVGLNWDFNVGGCVSRISNGGVDWRRTLDYQEYYKPILDKDSLAAATYYFSTDEILDGLLIDAQSGHTELDFYSVALPTSSFYFFVDRGTSKPVIIGQDKGCYSVVADINGSQNCVFNTNDIDGWIIKDGNGYEYEFYEKEQMISDRGVYYNSVWYIRKLTSPTGNTTSFYYTNPSLTTFLSSMSEFVDIEINREYAIPDRIYNFTHGNGLYTTKSYFQKQIIKPYLSKIETKEHEIRFVLGNREDIGGNSKKIDSIVVRSKLENEEIKRIGFCYSYFLSETVGGDYLSTVEGFDANRISPFLSKRLKLESVSFIDSRGNNQPYSFEYEETKTLPLKTSSAVDMWGYYNGKDNACSGLYTMVPDPIFCDVEINTITSARIFNYGGANRFADSRFTDALILKKIIYPTKGYTTFEYESNSFVKLYKNRHASGNHLDEDIALDVADNRSGNTTRMHQFTLDKPYKGTLSAEFIPYPPCTVTSLTVSNYVELYSYGSSGNNVRYTIYPSGSSEYDVSQQASLTKNEEVYLPAGDYIIGSCAESNLVLVNGELKLSPIDKFDSAAEETVGGGLRIKRINSYHSNDTLLEYSEYEYKKLDGRSSGLLINPLGFAKSKSIIEDYANQRNIMESTFDQNQVLYDYLSFSNDPNRMTTFASAMSPNDIGYSRVIKTRHTKDGTIKEISNFVNTENSFDLQDLCCSVNIKNGSLSSKEFIDERDRMVKKEDYNYSTDSILYRKSFSIEDRYLFSGNSDYLSRNNSSFTDRFKVNCYSFALYNKHLMNAKVTDYADGVELMSTITSYEYDTTNNQISSVTKSILGADGNPVTKFVTEYTYATTDKDNYPKINPSSSWLVNKHFMNAIVQLKNSVISAGVKTSIQTIQNQYDSMRGCRLAVAREAIGTGQFEERLRYFYDYNSDPLTANIKHVIKDGIDDIVYLWSYKGIYPIAKIEGLSYDEVESAIGRSIIEALLIKDCPTEADFTFIRSEIEEEGGMITTYTYKPLVGITSQTLPNGVKTEFRYDGFGRLIETVDGNGNTTSKANYNYKR